MYPTWFRPGWFSLLWYVASWTQEPSLWGSSNSFPGPMVGQKTLGRTHMQSMMGISLPCWPLVLHSQWSQSKLLTTWTISCSREFHNLTTLWGRNISFYLPCCYFILLVIIGQGPKLWSPGSTSGCSCKRFLLRENEESSPFFCIPFHVAALSKALAGDFVVPPCPAWHRVT